MNRIIKAGIRWIARITRVTSTAAKCREVIMRMDAVTDFVGTPRSFAKAAREQAGCAALDRRHVRLAPLLKVLRLLVNGLGAAPEAGIEAPGPTLMFNMSKIFEALLASRLRRVIPDCNVDEQVSRQFDIQGRFLLRPDLVVHRRGEPKLVVDAKWKRAGSVADVIDEDLRQAFAYARILGVKHAALVFPKLDSDVLAIQEVQVADGSEVRIHLWSVNVMAPDWIELDKDLCRLATVAGIGPSLDPARHDF